MNTDHERAKQCYLSVKELYKQFDGIEISQAIKQIRMELELTADQVETRAKIAQLEAKLKRTED